ncbi:metallophosphoesterase [Rufibacter sp. LB8]|uniref:metallophosphoesterase family protein n=1 Tax=Rufibacter sp. LB8 TaxID=2777781 RepID=UPI00178C7D7F|nr:metallophosphoesterase [Rufibacter sp. LB8]
MKRVSFLLLLFLLFSAIGCEELFEYHPNQVRLTASERNLTQKNLNRLQTQTPKDTLRLLVMGDTQRFYDATVDFVEKANSIPDIDLVVHLGDISDFGLSQEFKWVHDIMKRLKYPYLTVIGNHDMLGNARTVYQQMYGNFNYSVVYGHTKLVFIDTNGREYGFNGQVPDLTWLQQELQPAPEATWSQAVVLSHVPPFDGDFDQQLELPYHRTLAESKVVPLSLHGHRHGWMTETKYDDPSILYHVTTTVKKRGFTLLKLWKGGYQLERIDY